jgi:beta-lactamase class A
MLIRLCLAFLLSAALLCAQTPAYRAMDKKIAAAISKFKGSVWLYAKNLDTGETYGLRENEKVRTASTIKLPILVAVHAAVEAGKANWSERLLLKEEEKVGGSGVLHEFTAGQSFPLSDLCNIMIVVSDNTATNLVLDRIGADYVNEIMDSLKLPGTRSMRKVLRGNGGPEGWSKAGSVEENKRFGIGSSTPKEMVTLLEGLYKGTVISPSVSKQILDVMKRQQYKVGIGRRFDDRTPVMSKSGALDALRSDTGLIFVPVGKFAISITVDDMPLKDYSPDNVGNLLISELTGYLLAGLGK